MPKRMPVSRRLIKSKFDTNKARARSELAANLRQGARVEWDVRTTTPAPYGYLGSHYDSLVNGRGKYAVFKDEFNAHVASICKLTTSGEKKRWLDVGPGRVRNFMPFFEQLDPENKLIDLHTLAPNQILPRKKENMKNEEYEKYKPRLTHHVGAIETYSAEKLGSYHVIVSLMGGLVHNDYPNESMIKVAKMLAPGGKAFLEYFDPYSAGLVSEIVKLALGKKFEVAHKGYGLVIISKK